MQAFAAASARGGRRAVTGQTAAEPVFHIIIELNADMPGGAKAARALLLNFLNIASLERSLAIFGDDFANTVRIVTLAEDDAAPAAAPALGANETFAVSKSLLTERYLFATLTRPHIEYVVTLAATFARDPNGRPFRLLYKAWLDREINTFVFKSSKTINADAAAIAFSALGEGIVWAVADSGIDATHPHFATHATLTLPEGLRHLDFTADDIVLDDHMPRALEDQAGHGTHVAGIIAGECRLGARANGTEISAISVSRKLRIDDTHAETVNERGPERITGVAPLCKLLSLKVLDDDRSGRASTLIAALAYVWRANDGGRRIRIHGVNLSVGYEFDAEWFAAGKSPLCNEVDQLVRSGVIVVAAAGNAGFGRVNAASGRQEQATLSGTIADPGNAELAITVGSTHRDMPHAYGVSYFSSKGPTADGRAKPDLLAPGERIISCATGGAAPGEARYREESGTSMAAPHVSGAIAAFLSIRNEFIREPERVKERFLSSATDLKRQPHYQGKGLIDLMRAIQAP
ncbi:S8 family peptidase [Terricaulis sp.]|uniref:S8 family peptidase n=1 Tax=Terricaulis sp. TaxID=2768686 RepID=UPI003784F932